MLNNNNDKDDFKYSINRCKFEIKIKTSERDFANKRLFIFQAKVSYLSRFAFSDTHPLIAKEIALLLAKLSYKLTLTWIPSHSGIKGNELADLAAKQAAIMLLTSRISTTSKNILVITSNRVYYLNGNYNDGVSGYH